MRVVLDTNVLVSGLQSPKGPPARLVGLLESGLLEPCVSDEILGEYRDVLARPHLGIAPALVETLLEDLVAIGIRVAAPPLSVDFPDPDDAVFLEVAVAANAEFLVTGNLRHFPVGLRHGIAVVSPREFLDRLRIR